MDLSSQSIVCILFHFRIYDAGHALKLAEKSAKDVHTVYKLQCLQVLLGDRISELCDDPCVYGCVKSVFTGNKKTFVWACACACNCACIANENRAYV